jgi:predicted sulfurtransferase
MPTNVKEMMAAANAAVPRLQLNEIRNMMSDADVLIVDVRDPPEVQASGTIRGAVSVSRGMLEFRADPDLSSHNLAFRRDKRIVR